MNNENKDQVVYLYLDDIIPNRFQPREVFDEKALKELAVSIKEHGVIQPIIVRSVKGKYEIIAGERRYKASALAGMTKIPAIIRNLDDKESSKVALLENLQRKNLTPIEEARTYQKILEIDEMTQEDLAKTMGKSQAAVSNKLRLLSLPDEVQDALLKEQISERHARALLNIPEAAKQTEMLKRIVTNKLSVRAVEDEIKKTYNTEEVQKENKEVSLNKPTDAITIPSTTNEKEEINVSKPTMTAQATDKVVDKFASFDTAINDDFDSEDSEPPMTYTPKNTTESNPFLSATTPKQAVDKNAADLDSLLNISIPKVAEEKEEQITPQQEEVKKIVDQIENSKVLQPTPLVKPVALQPTPVVRENLEPPKPTQTSIASVPVNPMYTTEGARRKIKEVISDFKDKGISISLEEMDFDTTYQIIIKIDK